MPKFKLKEIFRTSSRERHDVRPRTFCKINDYPSDPVINDSFDSEHGVKNSLESSDRSRETPDGGTYVPYYGDGIVSDGDFAKDYSLYHAEDRKKNKSLSDSPSSGVSGSVASDKGEEDSHVELRRKKRQPSESSGASHKNPRSNPPGSVDNISANTSSEQLSTKGRSKTARSSEPARVPDFDRTRIHAIQIPLVSQKATQQRGSQPNIKSAVSNGSIVKKSKGSTTRTAKFFRGIAQRLRESRNSRKSHSTVALFRNKNGSIGCESSRSIAFTRAPLRNAFSDAGAIDALGREEIKIADRINSDKSNLNSLKNSFSDSNLNNSDDDSLCSYMMSDRDGEGDLSPCPPRSQSALDSDDVSRYLDDGTPSTPSSSPRLPSIMLDAPINPCYQSVYKWHSLDNVRGSFYHRPPEVFRRVSTAVDIPPSLPENRVLVQIPSPVAEEQTPRSSIFSSGTFSNKNNNPFEEFEKLLFGSSSRVYDDFEDELDADRELPSLQQSLTNASDDGDHPLRKEKLRKQRSRTLEISGPFNPVHLNGVAESSKSSNSMSTEEKMRKYREIFGSAGNVIEGKRSRASSYNNFGSVNKTKQYWKALKLFPMRKAVSETIKEVPRSSVQRLEEEWKLLEARCNNRTTMPFLRDIYNIRQQLNDQLKWLDIRVETQTSLVTEIQDYFRRRSEVEMEYSKQLDKLAKQLTLRHKNEKPKREQWHLYSSYQCWQQLVNTTRKQSTDHAKIAELYQSHMINRLQHVSEDLQRIYRKCRTIGTDEHEELLKVLHELHTTMKTYHSYRTMEQQAANKLQVVESNREKIEQSVPKDKVEKSRRYRVICKELQKRSDKHEEARIKALKARNEYILCMEAANAAVQKYFVDDLSDLIDAMDFGFHTCFSRSLLMYNSTLDCLEKSLHCSQEGMKKCLENLDSRADKQKFLEYNNAAFMVPKKFTFQAHKGDVTPFSAANNQNNDSKVHVQVENAIYEDMEQRFRQLQKRLSDLKIENEEVWKTLETAEKTLMDMIESRDYDVSQHFDADSDQPPVSILNSAVPISAVAAHSIDLKATSPSNGCLIPKPPETVAIKLRADKQETEDFYLEKFREYTTLCTRISRLQARYDSMESALTKNSGVERTKSNAASMMPGAPPKRPRRKRIGRQAVTGQPKLFGGSLEEYVEATNQEIPLIIRSCIRVINLFGLHHQGVFRVSGSQVEINNFREAFERGEDPLSDISDASDINSVAGVLKLYLRELREPLFPIFYFDQLMDISQLSSKKEFISKARDVVRSLSKQVFVVLRYIFAFLNHLSEFSDENMMDPWNLAICFGPTLLPIPEDKNPVQYQNLVNELIKGLITYQEEIFPDSDGGMLYEKYISSDQPPEDDFDVPPSEDSQNITLTDEEVEVDGPSDVDDLVNEPEISCHLFGRNEVLEAVAQYDFAARHERELSFRRGDILHLYTQLSADWWKGSFRGKDGLIPDKYIMLNIRDEDRDRMSQERRMSSTSSESLSSSGISPQRQACETFSLHPSPNRTNSNHSPPPLSLTDPRGRRRSLSPTSLGGLKLHQYQTQMESLRKLRPSTSVNDALETSSSSLEDVSALTGAVSRLRRQSPVQARHTPVLQRRPIHQDFDSNTDLARNLTEALHNINLSIEHIEAGQRRKQEEMKNPSPPLSAGLQAPSTSSLLASSPIHAPACSVMPIKKDAPDLVQDLPPTAGNASGGSSGEESDVPSSSSPQPHIHPQPIKVGPPSPLQKVKQNTNLLTTESLTTAERFALTNQCTMRKGSPRPNPRNEIHGSIPTGGGHAANSTPIQSRRSSCGNVTALTQNCGSSVQKLKRMFTEPEKCAISVGAPPLSPKPPIKAKPVALLNRRLPGAGMGTPVSSRVTPPDSPGPASLTTPSLSSLSISGSSSSTSSPQHSLQVSQNIPSQSTQPPGSPHVSVREYKQTSC